jgi:hypothetical protein
MALLWQGPLLWQWSPDLLWQGLPTTAVNILILPKSLGIQHDLCLVDWQDHCWRGLAWTPRLCW